MCEVDVFAHHRFCDEFSHLVNKRFVATELSTEVPLEWNRCLKRFKRAFEVSHLLFSCQ